MSDINQLFSIPELNKVHYPKAPVFDFKSALDLPPDPKVDSLVQNVVRDIEISVVNARQEIFKSLIEDPGFLSTFGDDFVIEWLPYELSTKQSIDNPLDDVTFTITQQYRIRRRSTLESD